MSRISASSITVPEGFTLHRENSAFVLLPDTKGAFLNPIQEFNRDLSIASIRTWSERDNKIREGRLIERRARNEKKSTTRGGKKRKIDSNQSGSAPDASAVPTTSTQKETQSSHEAYTPHKAIILEPLSASGLRSIRYAHEIPHVDYIIANDLSADAITAMRRNISINGLGPSSPETATTDAMDIEPSQSQKRSEPSSEEEKKRLGKVRPNHGDACALMYNHRDEKKRVDVVDLDPYGTAAPFLDGAVQCVTDGGLLCITCTDLAVLAGTNYPEKCFSNYGGVPVKAEYTHEAALRLVLHAVATAAARYGRSITPLLSLSIDFYVRVFVQVRTSASDVKQLATKTAAYYVCTNCQSWYEQPFGRVVDKTNEKSGHVNTLYKTTMGPTIDSQCPECESKLHIAGPMWRGPIHDPSFAKEVLAHVQDDTSQYGTSARMIGMLTVASEEIENPFYFTPSRVSGHFHCSSPSLVEITSALLNAGHKVCRSHAAAGSLKTTASHRELHDIIRGWIKTHPVKLENIKEGSPGRILLSKEPQFEANWTRHPDTSKLSAVKLVRYQQNPTPNWGPASRPGNDKKRKRPVKDEGNGESGSVSTPTLQTAEPFIQEATKVDDGADVDLDVDVNEGVA